MNWLVEAFLDEGKHGPDHPESLGMKNKEDFVKDRWDKKVGKTPDKEAEHAEHMAKRERMKTIANNNENPYAKLANEKDKELAGKIDNAVDKHTKARQDAEKIGDNMKAADSRVKLGKCAAKSNELYHKLDSIDRHNRRHPEAKVANESYWLIESFQMQDKNDKKKEI